MFLPFQAKHLNILNFYVELVLCLKFSGPSVGVQLEEYAASLLLWFQTCKLI